MEKHFAQALGTLCSRFGHKILCRYIEKIQKVPKNEKRKFQINFSQVSIAIMFFFSLKINCCRQGNFFFFSLIHISFCIFF